MIISRTDGIMFEMQTAHEDDHISKISFHLVHIILKLLKQLTDCLIWKHYVNTYF